MRLSELIDDLAALRDALASALSSVNAYQEQIDSLRSDEATEVLQRILDDHKRHVAELVEVIGRLDVIQRDKFRQAGLTPAADDPRDDS
jgi:hypothetical protein